MGVETPAPAVRGEPTTVVTPPDPSMERSGILRLARNAVLLITIRGLGMSLAVATSVLLASRFGATAQADAFFFARRVTTGLQEALNRVVRVSHLPDIVRAIRTAPGPTVRRLWLRLLVRIVTPAMGVTVLGVLLAPYIVDLLAPGFKETQHVLAVRILRLLAFMVPGALALGIGATLVNATRRYGVPSIATQLPRIMLICVLLFLVPPLGVTHIAIALLVGMGIALCVLGVIVLWVFRQLDAHTPDLAKPTENGEPEEHAEITGGGRVLPLLIMHLYSQGSVWLDFAFVSSIGVGALSSLEYGTRLMTILPAAVGNTLIGLLYVEFAHQAVEENPGELHRSLVKASRAGLFILLPLVTALCIGAWPLVNLMLNRGAFTSEDGALTVAVMWWSSPKVMLNFVTNMLFTELLVDERAPRLRLLTTQAIVGFIARAGLLYLLAKPMGVAGIAFAGSLTNLVVLCAMYPPLRHYWENFLLLEDLAAVFRMFLALLPSGLSMAAVVHYGSPLAGGNELALIALLITTGLTGVLVYGGAAWLVRCPELREASELMGASAFMS